MIQWWRLRCTSLAFWYRNARQPLIIKSNSYLPFQRFHKSILWSTRITIEIDPKGKPYRGVSSSGHRQAPSEVDRHDITKALYSNYCTYAIYFVFFRLRNAIHSRDVWLLIDATTGLRLGIDPLALPLMETWFTKIYLVVVDPTGGRGAHSI